MAITNFPQGVSSFGIPQIGYGIPPNTGPVLIVGTNNLYCSPDYPTIASAIAAAPAGATLLVQPGSYDEAITISRPATSSLLTIVGLGNKGDCAIAPSSSNATALTNHMDNVTLVNIGLAGVGTGKALVNTGSRLRAYGCKLENDDGTGECAQMTLGTVAQRAAHTRGGGADCRLEGCEFAWAASGIELVCTDYGAVTELQVVNNWFHDLDTKHIYETVGSGGSASVMYASLLLQGNVHQTDEAGTAPTDYVLLNGNNANSGIMTGCAFPQALAGGKVLLSTKLICVGNFFTGGVSTGQPS